MIRYSARLQRKRERVRGTCERILPSALVLHEPFRLRVAILFEDSDDIEITVNSTDSVKSLIRKIEHIRQIPHGITRILFRRRSQTVILEEEQLFCNCFIGPKTRLYVQFRKSAEAGYEYYLRGNYREAAAHLSATLADPEAYPEYAAEYADICLRNLDGVERPRQEAAKWYLIASKSCDATVFSYLCSLSKEFECKMKDAEQKEKGDRKLLFGIDYYLHRLALVEDLVAEWNKQK